MKSQLLTRPTVN